MVSLTSNIGASPYRRQEPMRIVSLAEIQAAIAPEAAVEAVKAGFVAHAKGLVHCPRADADRLPRRPAGTARRVPCQVRDLERQPVRGGQGRLGVLPERRPRPAGRRRHGPADLRGHRPAGGSAPRRVLAHERPDRRRRGPRRRPETGPDRRDARGDRYRGTQAEMQAEMICAHLGLSSVCGLGPFRGEGGCALRPAAARRARGQPRWTPSARCATRAPSWSPPLPPRARSSGSRTFPGRSTSSPSGPTPRGRRNWTRASWAGPTPSSPTRTRSASATATSAPRCGAGEVAEDCDRAFGEMLALAEPDPRMARQGISVVDLTGMGVQDLANRGDDAGGAGGLAVFSPRCRAAVPV